MQKSIRFSWRMVLFLLATLLLQTALFYLSSDTVLASDSHSVLLEPTVSCVGTEACTGVTGTVGDNSCNGDFACYAFDGNVGDNSCNGADACSQHTGDVGNSSCIGERACNTHSGTVGENSCNGLRACAELNGNVGENSCNGADACFQDTGNVGDCEKNVIEVPECNLAVSLGWFYAEAAGGSVSCRWQTTTEVGVAGFNILSLSDQVRVQLNDELISSPVIDSVTPTDYSFVVSTEATQFLLQEVGIDGGETEHGPFELGVVFGVRSQAEGDLTPRIWLPLVNFSFR